MRYLIFAVRTSGMLHYLAKLCLNTFSKNKNML